MNNLKEKCYPKKKQERTNKIKPTLNSKHSKEYIQQYSGLQVMQIFLFVF